LARALLLVAALAGLARPGFACDSSSCSLLTRGDNGLVGKKRLRLDLSFGYTNQGVRLDGSQETNVVLRPRVFLEQQRIFPNFHQDITGYDSVIQFDATYGLGKKVNLLASLPLMTRHSHDVVHQSLEQAFGTTGIGDALLGVRAALGPRGLVLGASIKSPTGSYKVGGEFGGGIQDPTLQPGTGAFDFVGALLYTGQGHPFGLTWSLSGSYQATTTNGLQYKFGNQLITTAGVARAVNARVSLSFQAKYFHQDRNEFLGQGVPSTGSEVFYLTPGLRVNPARTVSFFAFLLLVPYQHVNEAQLAPRLAILMGLSKTF
jgi:hypothetical protein